MLINFTNEGGWDTSIGAYSDCTITLSNSGNADGIASISLETDKGRVLNSFDILVPRGLNVKKTVRADTTIEDRQIICKLVQIRKN